MKNRILALVLVIALAMSLTACGVPGSSSKEETAELSMGVYDEGSSTYTNDFLGLNCQLDENWEVYDAEQLAELQGLLSDLITDADLDAQMENSGSAQIFYAQADGGLVTLNIVVENLGLLYGSLLGEDEYADIGKEQLGPTMESLGLSDVTIENTTVTFAGEDHAAMTIHGSLMGTDFYEVVVCYKVGKYIAAITAGSYVSDETGNVLDMFSSL